jgi:hypothetical protein
VQVLRLISIEPPLFSAREHKALPVVLKCKRSGQARIMRTIMNYFKKKMVGITAAIALSAFSCTGAFAYYQAGSESGGVPLHIAGYPYRGPGAPAFRPGLAAASLARRSSAPRTQHEVKALVRNYSWSAKSRIAAKTVNVSRRFVRSTM